MREVVETRGVKMFKWNLRQVDVDPLGGEGDAGLDAPMDTREEKVNES